METEKGKAHAMEKLQERRDNAPKKINNASLPAGAPMIFYCISCGHVSDRLPESYICRPKKICDECSSMKELGWLE